MSKYVMKRNIDYKYKSFVMKTNMHKYVGLLDKQLYLLQNDGIVPAKDIYSEYNDLYDEYGAKFIKECHKINNASCKRALRLKDRITSYLGKGQCIFVTLTFTDEVLDQTSVDTRRKYVQRYLKSISDYYVANIDYGVDDRYTHREHYHALVVQDWISDKWDYGFTWFEKIHNINEPQTLAKYISKLCNHAIKDSTKRACYIYSRGV